MRKSMLICLLSVICLMLLTACVDTGKEQNMVNGSNEMIANGDQDTVNEPNETIANGDQDTVVEPFALATNEAQELTAEPSAVPIDENPSPEVSLTPEPVKNETVPSEAEVDETTSNDPVVIAESSNTVSDKEKQEVLDDLSRELDELLKGLGDLESMDDSDLNPDNIE